MAIQSSTRARSRVPAAPTPPHASSPSANANWAKSGDDALEVARREITRSREASAKRASGNYMPFRFRVPVGESREIVLLDSDFGFCFYEHQLLNPQTNKWDVYETCPKEFESCPVCDGAAGGKPSYYVMMLTCVDLTPWVTKKGEEVPFSRRLLPVKAQLFDFMDRLRKRHGTLRGVQLLMNRDTPQSLSIGQPEFQELHSEEAIMESFGGPAIVGQDGRVLKAENADCFPFAYSELFHSPSGEDLRRRYGGRAPAGSRQEISEEWDAPKGSPADDIPFE